MKKSDLREVTAMGVTVHIDPETIVNDYDYLELLERSTENGIYSVKAMRHLLGDEYERVKEELRDADGRLTNERMSEFAVALSRQVGELKNS